MLKRHIFLELRTIYCKPPIIAFKLQARVVVCELRFIWLTRKQIMIGSKLRLKFTWHRLNAFAITGEPKLIRTTPINGTRNKILILFTSSQFIVRPCEVTVASRESYLRKVPGFLRSGFTVGAHGTILRIPTPRSSPREKNCNGRLLLLMALSKLKIKI